MKQLINKVISFIRKEKDKKTEFQKAYLKLVAKYGYYFKIQHLWVERGTNKPVSKQKAENLNFHLKKLLDKKKVDLYSYLDIEKIDNGRENSNN